MDPTGNDYNPSEGGGWGPIYSFGGYNGSSTGSGPGPAQSGNAVYSAPSSNSDTNVPGTTYIKGNNPDKTGPAITGNDSDGKNKPVTPPTPEIGDPYTPPAPPTTPPGQNDPSNTKHSDPPKVGPFESGKSGPGPEGNINNLPGGVVVGYVPPAQPIVEPTIGIGGLLGRLGPWAIPLAFTACLRSSTLPISGPPDCPDINDRIFVTHFTSRKGAAAIMASGIINASSDTGHVEVMIAPASRKEAQNAGAKYTDMQIVMWVPKARLTADPYTKSPKALMFNTPGFQHIGGFFPDAIETDH